MNSPTPLNSPTPFQAPAPFLPAALAEADPLRVLPYRRFYEHGLELRFGRIKRLLKTSIVTNGAFGMQVALQDGTGLGAGSFARPGEFFGSNPELRLEAYVRRQSDLVITEDDGLPTEAFYAVAISRTYLGAVRQAAEQVPTPLNPATIIRLPTHQQALAILRRRQFNLLKGVTDEMARGLRDVTARGIALSDTRSTLAARIVNHVDNFPLKRAQALAWTQITDVHAEATLNTFQTLGIAGVKALVEFTLSVHGASRPCPKCLALAGSVRTISEARGVIPVHHRCQCGWTPVPA